MTHSANGPKVSLEEAQRIEHETAKHLFSTRKLSLIVDLDQTIVHATVDPTVGDWIAEGEAWEARQATSSGADSDSDESSPDEDDEVNPNWEALRDVKKFRLGPESFGLPPSPDRRRAKGKEKAVETQGCLYYVKPRYVTVSCVVPILIRGMEAPDGLASLAVLRPSMKCMFILWAHVLTPRKSARPLTRMASSSAVGS